jgi:predicted amidohydrolase
VYRSIDGWLDWYEELYARAAKRSCQLAVTTEDFTHIFNTAVYLDDRSLFQHAVDWQTQRIAERLAACAKRHSMYVVACYFAREGDLIHNVADLFGPTGDLVGRYRKVHMPQYEMWQATPGDSFPAFETDLGWISMLICYDQMWPEAAACCAMNGAQLICHPSAAVLKDFYMKQRATDGQIHYLSSTQDNSMISSPRAEILAHGGDLDPAIVFADVDLQGASMGDKYFFEYLYSGIQDHRERHLKFRRPETYQALTSPQPPLADQFPKGGVADSDEAIQKVYETVKKIRRKAPDVRGKYHWRW